MTNDRQKWQECGRKKSYFTKAHAINDMNCLAGKENLHVYNCPHCFCWHVGHKPGIKAMLKAFKSVKPLKNKKKYAV